MALCRYGGLALQELLLSSMFDTCNVAKETWREKRGLAEHVSLGGVEPKPVLANILKQLASNLRACRVNRSAQTILQELKKGHVGVVKMGANWALGVHPSRMLRAVLGYVFL